LFLGHNFRTANASKAIKGSKDAEYRLVFSKERKIALCGWGPGSTTSSKKL